MSDENGVHWWWTGTLWQQVGKPDIASSVITLTSNVWQNTLGYAVTLRCGVTMNPSASVAATVATGTGSTSSPTTDVVASEPSTVGGGITGRIVPVSLPVKAGWYGEILVTNGTVGTIYADVA